MIEEIRREPDESKPLELDEKPEFRLGSGLLIAFIWLVLLPITPVTQLFLLPISFLPAILYSIGCYKLTQGILARRRWASDSNLGAVTGKWLAITGIMITLLLVTLWCLGLFFAVFPLLYFPPVVVGGVMAIQCVLNHCREKT